MTQVHYLVEVRLFRARHFECYPIEREREVNETGWQEERRGGREDSKRRGV